MADYGITDSGFVLKRLADILQDMADSLSTVTDPVSGEYLTPDLSDENDPIVNIINAFSDSLSTIWENLQIANNQFDPDKATGAALTGLVQLNGLERTAGTYGTVAVTMTGTPGLAIAAGKQIANIAGTIVFELPGFTFDGSGNATETATRTEYGTEIAGAGEVVSILTPVSGWDTVTNALASVAGSLEETDTELRARRAVSTALPSSSLVESMHSGLSALDGVTFVSAYINSDMTTDSRGIAAKQYGIVIQGGDDEEIAETIFNRSSMYSYYGSTTVTIYDNLGLSHDIKFSRPTEVPVYVEIEIEIINLSIWPTDGPDQIKEAILLYASSGAAGLGISSLYDQDGYTPGQTVYANELYIPINTVQGMKVNSVFVGLSVSPTGNTATIDWDEIASFDADNILITVA